MPQHDGCFISVFKKGTAGLALMPISSGGRLLNLSDISSLKENGKGRVGRGAVVVKTWNVGLCNMP